MSVPVVLAAKHCHIPAIIHESDITPGLANKIAIRGAKKVCCNFPETMKYLPAEKAVLTGSPIRRELFHGDAEKSLHYCGFPDHSKPVLLIVGGSSGSKVINEAVRKVLPWQMHRSHSADLLQYFLHRVQCESSRGQS